MGENREYYKCPFLAECYGFLDVSTKASPYHSIPILYIIQILTPLRNQSMAIPRMNYSLPNGQHKRMQGTPKKERPEFNILKLHDELAQIG